MFSTNDSSAAHTLLELRQVNYRASVVVDGVSVSPVHTPLSPTSDGAAVGMFRRFYFDLGHLAVGDHNLSVTVAPPDHPGNASNTCSGCGQGGNHDLAQDVTSQYVPAAVRGDGYHPLSTPPPSPWSSFL
jgi:hypothetical protein